MDMLGYGPEDDVKNFVRAEAIAVVSALNIQATNDFDERADLGVGRTILRACESQFHNVIIQPISVVVKHKKGPRGALKS